MTQFGRPISDVTNDFAAGGFADLDEVSASDSDFAATADNTTGQLEVALTSSLADPAVSTGHIVRVRLAKADTGVPPSTDGNTQNMTVTLYQGTTLIATVYPSAAVGAWTQTDYTLTGAEADSIGTDYSDLRVRIDSPASGGGPPGDRRGGAVSWVVLELPDAPIATNAPAEAAAITGTASNASSAIGVPAGLASVSVAASDATISTEINAEAAAVTVAASGAVSGLGALAEAAAVTVAAANATVTTGGAGLAWHPWSATFSNPVAAATNAAAEAAAVTVAASDASVALTVPAEAAAVTVAASDAIASLGIAAEAAAVTVTASDAVAALRAEVGAAAVAVTAFNPTVVVLDNITADAEAAAVTVAAYDVTVLTGSPVGAGFPPSAIALTHAIDNSASASVPGGTAALTHAIDNSASASVPGGTASNPTPGG